MKVVILAGGTGTRFWPMSRKNLPKQFCSITSKDPMLKCTYDRFVKKFKKSDIYISCNEQFVPLINKIIKNFPARHFIIEPEKRDTAPAMGYAAAFMAVKFPNEPMVFAPSDHYFANESKFLDSLEVAEKLIKKTGKFLDIGAVPTFPSTVLGYTRIGKIFEKQNGTEVYRFKEHVEKPDYKKAKKYLEAGDYLWHVNYYMNTPAKFLEVFHDHQPQMYKQLLKIKDLFTTAKKSNDYNKQEIYAEYNKLKKDSFDYAITEKMSPNDFLIIKGDFGWSDVGAWDVLYEQLSREVDEEGNLVRANWEGIETNESLIFAPKGKLVTTVGVSNLVVVDTEDALLICPKGKAQDVKKMVDQIKKSKKDKYL